MNSPSRQDFETAWLAYRYVSRDLSAAEQAVFEERLGADQGAREMVAEIVELCAALESVPAQAFAPPTLAARVWRPLGWMSVGAAACLALMLGLPQWKLAANPKFVQRDEAAAANDQRLALTWTQSSQPADVGDELPAEEPAASSEAETSDSEAETSDSEAETSDSDDSDAGLEPPSWVTAAVDRTKDSGPVKPTSEEAN